MAFWVVLCLRNSCRKVFIWFVSTKLCLVLSVLWIKIYVLFHFVYLFIFICTDPYLNTDAGTMSPFEHGEVFVLDDGGEVKIFL